MFLTIQGGDYTINVSMIVEVEWAKGEAKVTMASGQTYDLDKPADITALKNAVGYKK